MSGWMSYFGGGKSNPRDLARESIVNLRQTALTLEKKEEHLLDKIDKEEKAARANAATNKRGKRVCGRAVVYGVDTDGQRRWLRCDRRRRTRSNWTGSPNND